MNPDEFVNSVVIFYIDKSNDLDEDTDTKIDAVVPFQIAYAVSIHKAQGLEYESVKVVITEDINETITHNIFYTAITKKRKEWYGKEKEADQLVDIICMAKNLSNQDAYIIIGIDEEKNYEVCSVKNDPNRRNTQMLSDFLRGKKFAGDLRPIVTVESFELQDRIIDVMVIHNRLDTPFYLKETYKNQLHANHIYVRLQDSNTPKNQSADMNHVEYLWKKRFGLLSSPVERIHLYLQHPEDLENSPSVEDKKYYKYAPEYAIEHTYEPYDHSNGYEYYLFAQKDSRPHWCDIKIMYHQTVLEEIYGKQQEKGWGSE